MDAYLQPLVSGCVYTTINRQRKKKCLEISKKSKNTVKRMLPLELRIGYVRVCVCVCVCVVLIYKNGCWM